MESARGWNRPSERKGVARSKSSGARSPALIGVVAVAILAAFVAWYFLVPSRSASPKDGPRLHKPATIPVVAAATNQPAPKVPAVNAAPKRLEEGVEVVSGTTTTNSSGAVIEMLVLANGKKVMKVRPPRPVFENACDQVIAMAISVGPGQSMPPLPHLNKSLEQDFVNSLANPIVIGEDDPDDVKELKARVKETKAYLVQEIKKGGSLLEILREHQAEVERNADSHLMAVQEMQKLRAECGEEAALAFVKEVNEAFRARGIPEIELKKSKQEQGREEHN